MTEEESTQFAIDCFARALRRRIGDGKPWTLAFFDSTILKEASDEWFAREHEEGQRCLDEKIAKIHADSERERAAWPMWLEH